MSGEKVEIVRRAYEILACVDERAVVNLIEAGLVDPDGAVDLSTAYADGPLLRLEDLHEFFDTQPWGSSTRLEVFRGMLHRRGLSGTWFGEVRMLPGMPNLPASIELEVGWCS